MALGIKHGDFTVKNEQGIKLSQAKRMGWQDIGFYVLDITVDYLYFAKAAARASAIEPGYTLYPDLSGQFMNCPYVMGIIYPYLTSPSDCN